MSSSRIARVGILLLVGTGATGCASTSPRPAAAPNETHGSASTTTASTGSGARTAGWVLIAAGANAGAVALGTSAMMLYWDGRREGECDADKACSSYGLRANDRVGDLSPWNIGAWGLAAAGIGGGLILLLTNPKSQTTVGVAPGPGGAVLTSNF